ncbi:MAG: alpha/beta fold hydrolase [Acidobacteriota bacterium]
MVFDQAPPLPAFIAERFPYRRRLYQLETGTYAGRGLHFVDHGDEDARPVVLFHGNPTWSFLWRKVIARLRSYRCIAPDMLGLGLSDTLPALDDHRLAAHADAMAELLEALDVRDAIFVCQDWGGPVSTATARRIPDRVAGFVVANTAIALPSTPRGTKFHQFARTPVVSDVAFRVLGFPLRTLGKVQADPSSIAGDVARAYWWPLRRRADRIAPLALARMVPDSEAHPDLPEMRVAEAWISNEFRGPMRLVWGVRDPILGRALKRHEARFPDVPVRRLEAGHFLQEEVPADLADAVEEVALELAGDGSVP